MSVDMTMFVNYGIQGILKREEISVVVKAIEDMVFKECFNDEPAMVSVHTIAKAKKSINAAIDMFKKADKCPVDSRKIAQCTGRMILWRSDINEADKISLYKSLFLQLESQIADMKKAKKIYNVTILNDLVEEDSSAAMFTLDCGRHGYIIVIVFAKSGDDFTRACEGLYGIMCLLKKILAGKLPEDKEPAGIDGYVDKTTAAAIRSSINSWFTMNSSKIIDEAKNILRKK